MIFRSPESLRRKQEIVYFITPTPKGGNFGVKCVKLMLFIKKTWFRQIKYIVTINKEISTKIVNFMNPGTEDLVLGHGQMCHIVNMHYFFKKFLSTPRHISDKLSTYI